MLSVRTLCDGERPPCTPMRGLEPQRYISFCQRNFSIKLSLQLRRFVFQSLHLALMLRYLFLLVCPLFFLRDIPTYDLRWYNCLGLFFVVHRYNSCKAR